MQWSVPVFAERFLDAFAKLLKATITFLMSVRAPVRMEQHDSHWTDVREILRLKIFLKYFEEKLKI